MLFWVRFNHAFAYFVVKYVKSRIVFALCRKNQHRSSSHLFFSLLIICLSLNLDKAVTEFWLEEDDTGCQPLLAITDQCELIYM